MYFFLCVYCYNIKLLRNVYEVTKELQSVKASVLKMAKNYNTYIIYLC